MRNDATRPEEKSQARFDGNRLLASNETQPPRRGRALTAVRGAAFLAAAITLVFTTSGCLATRNWVRGQVDPVNAKADRALTGLQNLHLERKFVLDSQHGPTFAFGSATLTPDAKQEINAFVEDLDASGHPSTASGRVFVIAGHTDDVGSDDYNYELGQRRADRVAGYLVGREGIDPAQVRVVSYGPSKPVADNNTAQGRRANRRVEILVYQETIASGS